MSLKQIIAEKSGTSVPLAYIIRTATILLNGTNKKVLIPYTIRNAFCIHFRGDKCKQVQKEGTKMVTEYIAYDTPPTELSNMNAVHNHIKNILLQFNIHKCSKNTIAYLMAIYDDIQNYEMQDVIFEEQIDIKDFLRCCIYVLQNHKKLKMKEEHYHLAKEILSPNTELNLDWTIPRNEQSIKEYFEDYHLNIDQSFIQHLIYNLQLLY